MGEGVARLQIRAGDLADALKPARPHPLKKKPKPVPVSLEYDAQSATLWIVEAQHGAFEQGAPASGSWPPFVQVEGTTFSKVARTWPEDDVLELSTDGAFLVVTWGRSVFKQPRVDGGGRSPILRAPPKPNRKHKGRVVHPPDKNTKPYEWGATWDFSARMPVPQHRRSSEED